MRLLKPVAAGLLILGLAGPALAEGPKIYRFESNQNFCPDGLQPITISGVICCGTPNQSMTYQQVMRHPVSKKRVHRAKAADTCPEGTKGCY